MPIDYDSTSSREQFVNLTAYDYDLFSKDDFIAKKSFSIRKILQDVDAYDVAMKMDKKYWSENIEGYYKERIANVKLNEPDLEKRAAQVKAIESQYKFYEFESEDPKKFWVTLDAGCLTEEKDEVKRIFLYILHIFS